MYGRFDHLTIIGLGATGCALLPLAATLPFRRITLIDGDTIEQGNLLRQPLYGQADIGKYKVEVAAERTSHLHQNRELSIEKNFVDGSNIRALLPGAVIVADCTDDAHARKLIDEHCGNAGIPLVSGAVHGTQLQVATLHADRNGGSLRSFFPGRIGAAQDGCDMRNVPIETVAFTAALMMRRLRAVIENDPAFNKELDLVDLRSGEWTKILQPVPNDASVRADPERS